ncbi:zinc finger protein 804A [Pelodytes ibericus]
MECYYIVISSSHLSKGHLRNIKGVFRGPLTSDKTLELSEKENTKANSLEYLKSNFYCELCDKQYHKHQEFDNHINSYDHAHKQRLKELKQREFARNVASKLRKNERKQKKYLEKLHKLADLRREATCAPGSGPMFKSTTVTVRDHVCESLKNAIVCSVEKEEPKCSPFESTSVMSILLSSSDNSENKKQNTDDQVQKANKHKVSFSFAFPKKTRFKLESSAAVFYDINDDIISDPRSQKQTQLVSRSLTAKSTLSVETTATTEKDIQSVQVIENQSSFEGHVLEDVNLKHIPERELSTLLDSDICHLKVPSDSSASENPVNIETLNCSQEFPFENKEITVISSTPETIIIQSTCEEINLDGSVNSEDPELKKSTRSTTIDESMLDQVSNCILSPAKAQAKDAPHRQSKEAFHPVQSKDGSKVLQWPSEMLMYTYTQPSISYSCNPLYFDFRATKNCARERKYFEFSQDNLHTSGRNTTQEYDNTRPESKSSFTFNGSKPSREVLKTSCDFVHSQDNVKCCSLICSIKENEKHAISKLDSNKEVNLDHRHNRITSKSTRKSFHKSERRKQHKNCIHIAKVSKFRYGKRCHIYGKRKNVLKTLEKQAVESKDSFCSLKYLTNPSQIPHAETEHVERQVLRIPTLQIKQECEVWNVHHKTELTNQSGTDPSKYIETSNNPSERLHLNHYTKDIIHYNELCSWDLDKMHSNNQKDKIFFRRTSIKRTYTSVINEIDVSCKRQRLCKPVSSSLPIKIFSKQKLSVLCKPLGVPGTQVHDTRTEDTISSGPCSKSLNIKSFNVVGNLLAQNSNQLEKKSFAAKEFLKNIEKIKKVVENKLDQLCKSLFDIKDGKATEFCSAGDIPEHMTDVRNHEPPTNQKEILPEETTKKTTEQNKQLDTGIPYLPCSKNKSEQRIMKSPLSDRLAGQVYNESRRNCLKCNTEALAKQPSPCMNSQTFITDKLFSNAGLPYQATCSPKTHSKRHKYHQCDTYNHAIQPSLIPSKFRLIFPAIAVQSCASLYPVQLEQPFCPASVATVQPTLLQHNAADSFTATSVDSVKLVEPAQHFMSPQCQVFSRTPFYQITVEPRFCPGDPFMSSPQVLIIRNQERAGKGEIALSICRAQGPSLTLHRGSTSKAASGTQGPLVALPHILASPSSSLLRIIIYLVLTLGYPHR